jgi:uncharacterized iron-regulated membrane protein
VPVLGLMGTGGAIWALPQIDSHLARPYAHVAMVGPAATAGEQASAAVAAVPGSVLLAYELPPTPDAAVRVTVGRGTAQTRVYVHPQTLAVLRTERAENRPLTIGPFCDEPDYTPLDRLVSALAARKPGAPVLIVAPARPDGTWTVKSGTAGRALPPSESPRAI